MEALQMRDQLGRPIYAGQRITWPAQVAGKRVLRMGIVKQFTDKNHIRVRVIERAIGGSLTKTTSTIVTLHSSKNVLNF